MSAPAKCRLTVHKRANVQEVFAGDAPLLSQMCPDDMRLLQPMFEGLLIHDGENVIRANSVLEEMFGFGAGEMDGQQIRSFVEPSHHQVVRDRIDSKDNSPYEAVGVRRDGSRIWVQVTGTNVTIQGRAIRLTGVRDLTNQKRVEEQLRTVNSTLVNEQSRLQRKNAALSELLERLQAERDELAAEIHANLERLVFPILRRLIAQAAEHDRRLLQQLSANLKEITAPYIYRLESIYSSLSPREVEICGYIKAGLTCKDVASTLNVSVNTVLKQRQRIRQKLGINNENINLATYLRTI